MWLKSVTGTVPLAAAAAIFSVSHSGWAISWQAASAMKEASITIYYHIRPTSMHYTFIAQW